MREQGHILMFLLTIFMPIVFSSTVNAWLMECVSPWLFISPMSAWPRFINSPMATIGVLVDPGPPAAALAKVIDADEMTWMTTAQR